MTCDSARTSSDGTPPHDIDIAATTAALQDRVAAGRMREVAGDVPLADMIDLFAADMKYTIVSFLECLDCGQLLEWGLCIRGAPIFKHIGASTLDAKWWDEVPERFKWIGTASFAALDAGAKASEIRSAVTGRDSVGQSATPVQAMQVVAGLTGSWFLLQRGVDLFLSVRPSREVAENTLLFRLDAAEKAEYERHGKEFLHELLDSIDGEVRGQNGSGFDARTLYRGRSGPQYRQQASDAIRAWKNSQPRAGACEVCSFYWVTGIGRGETLGESDEFMAEVRRCRNCGAYWEVGAFSYPKVITRAQAMRELPDLTTRETALGIDFPDPPPFGGEETPGGKSEQ